MIPRISRVGLIHPSGHPVQTALLETVRDTLTGPDAERALRACVHCGFCNAVCPTYHLLAEEADGPRGRIYLIKSVLEGTGDAEAAQVHLDRCLTCRACESLCPSGVPYAALLEVGREACRRAAPRTWGARLLRRGLRLVFPYRGRVSAILRLVRLFLPLLPRTLAQPLRPEPFPVRPTSAPQRGMRALLFAGCVQPAAKPGINQAAERILTELGWEVLADPGSCCGALSHHLTAESEARRFMRHNIDAWWPLVETGLDAIVVTASGCTALLKDYGRLLADDQAYAEKAERISSLVRDISQCLEPQDLADLVLAPDSRRVALHRPCTLDHSVQAGDQLKRLLRAAGFVLTDVEPEPGCCGSAGTYSLLQPTLAKRLRHLKLAALQAGAPDVILTANIGCLMHLQGGSLVPVQHWVQALAERLPQPAATSGQ